MAQIETSFVLPKRADHTGWIKISGRGEYRWKSTALRDFALTLGLESVDGKTITPAIERASGEFCRGVLRGLFDADGTVNHTKGPSIYLNQSDELLLKTVQRLLLRLGIPSTLYKNRKAAGSKLLPDGHNGLKEYSVKASHDLTIIGGQNLTRFQQIIGFSDTAKAQKLTEQLVTYRKALRAPKFEACIESIIPDGDETVYDAQIPGPNLVVANGIVAAQCGEQPLLPYESCNLGSVNLARHTLETENGRSIDWPLLKQTIQTGVRFLDNVIERNAYPLPEIEAMTRKTRRIGLGIMGWADLLIQMGISYASPEAVSLIDEIMAFFHTQTHAASQELAQERGVYPAWAHSLYNVPMRNTAPVTIAPTGTISIIADCSSGIEPLFSLAYTRTVMDGTQLPELNPYFEAIMRHKQLLSPEVLQKVSETGTLYSIPGLPNWAYDLFTTSHTI